MTDVDIAKRFKMPYQTLVGWKKDKSKWRYTLYLFIKKQLEREEHDKN